MNKKYIIISLLIVFTAVCIAQIQQVSTVDKYQQVTQPGQLYTAQNGWVVIGATASAGDEPNDLAVGERTYATVSAATEGGDDKIIIYGDDANERLEMSSWNGARFRCIGITNDQTVTYQIYLGTLEVGGTDCILAYAGQLAFTIGTQASTTSTYELADTLTATDGECSSWTSYNPGNNRVATGKIDLESENLIIAIPTTVSCDCKLIAKGY